MRTALACALLVSGVLVFADAHAVAVAGGLATVALLLAIGFRERDWAAVLWAFTLVLSAVIADALWQADWEPFNRSEDYEAIPQTPFVLLGVPIPMAIVLLGVLAARLTRRRRG